jgi:hypothetical protein
MPQLRRRDLIVGEQYRMTDYYASDSPLAQGTIVTVINRKGEIRIGDSMLRGGLGIVVVITAELVEAAKATLLAGGRLLRRPSTSCQSSRSNGSNGPASVSHGARCRSQSDG